MGRFSKLFYGASMLVLVPMVANAAGTYYTGGYQSPQTTRYNSSAFSNTGATRATSGVSSYNQARYNAAGYNTSQYNTTGYNTSRYGTTYTNRYGQNARVATTQNRTATQAQPVAAPKASNGFHIDAGMSYKTGMWQFEMNNAGSKLHYDNLSWGVLDVNAGYDFNVGNTTLTIDAGLEYGMQLGESTMIDDDITNGGFEYATWPDSDNSSVTYKEYLHSLSIGATKDGDMLGLRAGIGLKDVFALGKIKMTPSIGWRHLNYKLETTNNYGTTIATVDGNNGCVTSGGMTQCWPAIAFFKVYNGGTDDAYAQYTFGKFDYIDIDNDENKTADVVGIPVDSVNGDYVDVPESLYFHMSDVSHSYDVTWSGPYLAMDMLYDINANNSVTARVELGLPMYTVTADQPYRPEWQHPKSIEDKGDFGSAIHFGAGANWRTALTDNVSLTLGVTYDYYNVSGATANTYLNPTVWQDQYDSIFASYVNDKNFDFSNTEWAGASFDFYHNADKALSAMLNGFIGPGFDADNKMIVDDKTGDPIMYEYLPNAEALYIEEVRANGWKDTVKDEIDSFFRSLGVRVGLNIKF